MHQFLQLGMQKPFWLTFRQFDKLFFFIVLGFLYFIVFYGNLQEERLINRINYCLSPRSLTSGLLEI